MGKSGKAMEKRVGRIDTVLLLVLLLLLLPNSSNQTDTELY